MNKINIIGESNSGLTTIGLIIMQALENAGFTDYNFITNSSEEFLMDQEMQDKRIDTIRNNTDVVIEEIHIRKME